MFNVQMRPISLEAALGLDRSGMARPLLTQALRRSQLPRRVSTRNGRIEGFGLGMPSRAEGEPHRKALPAGRRKGPVPAQQQEGDLNSRLRDYEGRIDEISLDDQTPLENPVPHEGQWLTFSQRLMRLRAISVNPLVLSHPQCPCRIRTEEEPDRSLRRTCKAPGRWRRQRLAPRRASLWTPRVPWRPEYLEPLPRCELATDDQDVGKVRGR